MAEKRDFYDILGVTKSADAKAIKSAYRKLVHKYHPDRNKAADAGSKFKEIQEAYEVLGNEEKRSSYDKYGHAGVNNDSSGFGAGGFGQGGADFSNFSGSFSNFAGFEDLFGGAEAGGLFENFFGGRTNPNRVSKGEDLRTEIEVTLEEAAFGTTKKIRYQREVKCNVCDGTGSKNKELKECTMCKGRGQVTSVQRTLIGNIQMNTVCPECQGKGKVPKTKCSECGGDGIKAKIEDFEIKVPKGVKNDSRFRFREKGNAGENGGESGDLYVDINVLDHELFTRDGDNILLQYRVPLKTVVLGGEVEVPTLYGEENVKVPAGTQYGEVIKLKEKGMPTQNEGTGDQFIKIVFDIPKKLSSEERKLWEEMSEE